MLGFSKQGVRIASCQYHAFFLGVSVLHSFHPFLCPSKSVWGSLPLTPLSGGASWLRPFPLCVCCVLAIPPPFVLAIPPPSAFIAQLMGLADKAPKKKKKNPTPEIIATFR